MLLIVRIGANKESIYILQGRSWQFTAIKKTGTSSGMLTSLLETTTMLCSLSKLAAGLILHSARCTLLTYTIFMFFNNANHDIHGVEIQIVYTKPLNSTAFSYHRNICIFAYLHLWRGLNNSYLLALNYSIVSFSVGILA